MTKEKSPQELSVLDLSMYPEATIVHEAGSHLKATNPGANGQMENLARSDLARSHDEWKSGSVSPGFLACQAVKVNCQHQGRHMPDRTTEEAGHVKL